MIREERLGALTGALGGAVSVSFGLGGGLRVGLAAAALGVVLFIMLVLLLGENAIALTEQSPEWPGGTLKQRLARGAKSSAIHNYISSHCFNVTILYFR